MRLLGILVGLIYVVLAAGTAGAAGFAYKYDFEQPMSWADDAVPWGMGGTQKWSISTGGRPGQALCIDAKPNQHPVNCEIRTLMFNHKPNESATISFDVKAVCIPDNAFFAVRYFDGYCGALPFERCTNDEMHPFPAPIYDTKLSADRGAWWHIAVRIPPLKNTILTIAFFCQQGPSDKNKPGCEFINVYLDNLKVEVAPLDRLMDPGFDWHGNYGANSMEFWQNTLGADGDWCDYADQEEVTTPDGGVIHYTLLQHRDTSASSDPSQKYQIRRERHCAEAGGFSTMTLSRIHAGNSAVSWGVRQTVSYKALGLSANDTAKIQIRVRASIHDPNPQRMGDITRRIGRIQVGVDTYGQVITRKATWSEPVAANLSKEGWRILVLDFAKPKGAEAFTVFFRHTDGTTQEGEGDSYEPQSQGTEPGSRAVADWVIVKVLK